MSVLLSSNIYWGFVMKIKERDHAIALRTKGLSINEIAKQLHVAKSSVSTWVRHVIISPKQYNTLLQRSHTTEVIEKRRHSRLLNEETKRNIIISEAQKQITKISNKELWLMGVMLYWAEGGKTQRMVRFSNGDPEMIKIMMEFFRRVCRVPEPKFRGYIHIHPHLNIEMAEQHWSEIAKIPKNQFFKTYSKQNKSSKNKKDTLPHGVLDIYVLDTKLFLKIVGWAKGIFATY